MTQPFKMFSSIRKSKQMKGILKLGAIFLLTILSLGCDDNDFLDNDNPILGKWKLAEASISSGGPQYIVPIDDGEEFTFSNNGTFSLNRHPECTSGSFSIKSNELILKYNCPGFTTGVENSNGAITYSIILEEDYFILAPTSVTCIEGCSYTYKRITSEI